LFADGGIRFGDSSAGAPTNYAQFASDGELTLVGTAKVLKKVTMLPVRSQLGNGTRGVFKGLKYVIWNEDNYEEYYSITIPTDWDETSDPTIYLDGWLNDASDSNKFKMVVQAEVADFVGNGVVPDTNNNYEDEITTGSWAAYTGFQSDFVIDASEIGLSAGETANFRIRRIPATSDEYTGDIYITNVSLEYTANKLGAAT